MLDETTCPVCGKELNDDVATDWIMGGAPGTSESRMIENTLWAVAHYLAHLVQQSCKHALTEPYAVNADGGTYHRCVSCHAITGYVPSGSIIDEANVIQREV